MNSDWKTIQFRQLCDITRGASPRPIHDYLGNAGMPWIKIADATAEASRFLTGTRERIKESGVQASVEVFPGDLILSNSATPGLPKFLKINACIHDGWMLLRNFRDLDKRFAYWLLISERPKLVAQGNGSVFTNLKTDILKSHTVTIPPLPIQIQIADVLDALDDRIAVLRETNATLEAIAQALFKSWFVDFDPVRAKSQGLAPAGMDEATAALFPDAFEGSALGHLPAGWKVVPVEDIAERVGMGPFGSNIKVSTFVDQGIPVISGAHLHGTLLEDFDFNFITEEHAARLKNSCVFAGDVVFTHAGSIGQVALVPKGAAYSRYVLSQRQFYLRCDLARMRPAWMTYFFRSPQGRHLLLANASQVGVPSIARPVSYLRSIQFALPPMPLVNRFADVVDELHGSVVHNRERIQSLTKLRDTLLPRLISGQLRLPLPECDHEATAAIALPEETP